MLTGQLGFISAARKRLKFQRCERINHSMLNSRCVEQNSRFNPTYSSPAETSSVTSSTTAAFQSASVRSSWPVPATKIRDGFFSRSFDCAALSTSDRIDVGVDGSCAAEAGMTSGAFWDCLAFRARVTRVASMMRSKRRALIECLFFKTSQDLSFYFGFGPMYGKRPKSVSCS